MSLAFEEAKAWVLCPVCNRMVALNAHGKVRRHTRPSTRGAEFNDRRCGTSGRKWADITPQVETADGQEEAR